MIAISAPRREDAFTSRLDTPLDSSSDVVLQGLSSSFSFQTYVGPASSTPRSLAKIRSTKRAKLSRSTSLEGGLKSQVRTMKFLGEGDELEEVTAMEDSGDDTSSITMLSRTNTTSTGSLNFQISEDFLGSKPTNESYTTLSTYAISTKGFIQEYEVPKNFSMVWPGVYRSSFPAEAHFQYLKMLKLKTVLTLIPEKYPQSNVEFMQSNGIQHIQIGIAANKEPFVEVPLDKITEAVSVILDKRNHPILIHCNKGKHRTGCIVGCLRKIQKWALSNVFDEYRRFSHPKERVLDEQVIELWEEKQLLTMAQTNGWALS